MKNRFNTLTSKEWLPFQKSWFRFEDYESLFEKNIRFFTLPGDGPASIYYSGPEKRNLLFSTVANRNLCKSNSTAESSFNFAMVDLLDSLSDTTTLSDYEDIKNNVVGLAGKLHERLDHRRFLCLLVQNVKSNGSFHPFAWDLAKAVAQILTLKDEKIACLPEANEGRLGDRFEPGQDTFYCLYFRNDENSSSTGEIADAGLFNSVQQQRAEHTFNRPVKSWHVLKPQPRKKNEILHPAKYPEDLVDLFVNCFTAPGQNVLDPMSGTGSTQLGALRNGRNGYGTELSSLFAEIARTRCQDFLDSATADGHDTRNTEFSILQKDARDIQPGDFPPADYILTSPPYWDMLNMKGAENQANRRVKGLQLNYSDDSNDLGNVSDYEAFLTELCDIYFNLGKMLKPGQYMTIVVKNIKKKGKNYPLAWDLARRLQKEFILLPEIFWCQDDISIAPYGYGNTFVSNTFHHYCLNFQKPVLRGAKRRVQSG